MTDAASPSASKLKPIPEGLQNFKTAGPQPSVALEFPRSMPGPLVVTVLDKQYEREGRSTVVLCRGFRYLDRETGREIRVPRTYVTDFASIPWIVRGLIESFGRHARAAVVHDWLYAVNEGKRGDADKVALRAMEDLGVHPVKRYLIYTAICWFGCRGWKNAGKEWLETWADPETGDRRNKKYDQSIFYEGASWPDDSELGQF